MIYGSVCSGIEAATTAWHPLGWKPAFFSEIEAFPRSVLAHHYPDVPCHGDFTTIGTNEYGSIDLLVGGTPCQSFSIAGLRGGLDDDRGNLALEFLRLAQRTRAKWLVWENVPGVLSSNGGRDFGAILGGMVELGYGFAYRVLDAQFFGVAQRRRRVFVVGHLGSAARAAAVLFERHSLQGHPSPRREKGEEIAGTIARSSFSGDAGGRPEGAAVNHFVAARMVSFGEYEVDGTASTLKQRDYKDATDLVCFEANMSPLTHGGDFDVATLDGLETARTLTRRYDGSPCHDRGPDVVAVTYPINLQIATRHNALGEGTGLGVGSENDPAFTLLRDHHHAVGTHSVVRRLTPIECERLQGFPDNFTAIPWRGKPADQCPDGPRYKALGNSMAVPVMRWIGERIQMVEDLKC